MKLLCIVGTRTSEHILLFIILWLPFCHKDSFVTLLYASFLCANALVAEQEIEA